MKQQSFSKIFFSITLFLVYNTSLIGIEADRFGDPSHYSSGIPPRKSISSESWEKISQYLLPADSKIKEKLDAIFGEERVTLNSDTLEMAGFKTGKPRKYSRIVVTKHKKLPGYIFKIYLDDEREKPDYKAQHFLVKRVRGALAIENFIEENHLQDVFKVPKKWIYLLPETPKLKKKYSYKNFILVEEDMNILDKEANKQAWKSSKVTKAALLGLYNLIKEVGLSDCTKIDNIPFSVDGRITFIDTEHHGYAWTDYKRLTKRLPHKLQDFWNDLTRH